MTLNQEERPNRMAGYTYKLKVPNAQGDLISAYITINNSPITNKPFEMFINGFDSTIYEWLSLSMVLISRLLRVGVDAEDVIADLRQIHSAKGPHVVPGHGMSPSLASRIGDVLEEHIKLTSQTDEHQVNDE